VFDNLRAGLTGIGFESVQGIREGLRAKGKEATGKLINDTRFEIVDTGSMLTLLLKAPKYYINVDKGRRAGSKQPPLNKIKTWMRRKGIKGSPFVIARSIARKGIEPTGIYSDATKKTIKAVRDRVGELAFKDLKKLTIKNLK